MHSEGDVVPISQLESPVSGRLSRLLRTLRSLVAQPSVKPGEILESKLVIVPLLKVRLISSCFVLDKMVFFFLLNEAIFLGGFFPFV